jgi:predicted TIM-barrel fold metal-dependent hydrolase
MLRQRRNVTNALSKVGAERMMFAVEYPDVDSEGAVDALRSAHLPSAERAMIEHENADRLFRLKLSGADRAIPRQSRGYS